MIFLWIPDFGLQIFFSSGKWTLICPRLLDICMIMNLNEYMENMKEMIKVVPIPNISDYNY